MVTLLDSIEDPDIKKVIRGSPIKPKEEEKKYEKDSEPQPTVKISTKPA